MIHYAQPPPTVLEVTTTNQEAIRSLIHKHEAHRDPVFTVLDRHRIRVTFPRGFDDDSQAVLRQLITELRSIGATNIKVERQLA